MRIDAHFHVWDLETHHYPWLQQGEPIVRIYGSSAPLRHSYRIEDYVADASACGIGAGVFVQCGMHDPLEEVRYIQQLADERRGGDFPIMIVGYADLASPGALITLERLAEVPNVRGVRYSIAWDPDPLATFALAPVELSGDAFMRAFAALGDLGLRLDCMLYPAQMQVLSALCERYPSTPVIINHTGLPLELHDAGLERWREGMHVLAGHSQVSVKISGLGMIRHDWVAQGESWARDIIAETIDTFGVDRCMFASNYPVERLASAFSEVYRTYEAAVVHRPEEERSKLFGDNAFRLYGF